MCLQGAPLYLFMNKKTFIKKQEFENNTIYSLNEKRIDYFIDDCISLDNEEYFVVQKTYSSDHKACVFINNKENIVLDFKGGTLFCNGALSPFIIRDSSNIEIKNVSICFDRAFHTQMTLIEKGKDFLKCLVDPRFPYRIEDGKFIPSSKYWEDTTIHESCVFLQEFDSKTLKGLSWPVVLIGNKDEEAAKLPWGGKGFSFLAYQEGDYVVFKGDVPNYNVGSILVLAMNNRDIASIFMYNSKNIKLTNVRIINGLGMGVMPIYCENITIDNLQMKYDDKSIGIISNTADGIHTINCKGDIVLKNSYLSGMIDDAVNFHSNYLCLESINDNKVTVKCVGAAIEKIKLVDIGDLIALYNGDSLDEVDRATILNIVKLDRGLYELTLSKKITKNCPPGSLVENLSTQANITIENCYFGKANTHLRFQSRGKIRISKCICELPIIFTGDTYYWYESSPVNDLVISNVYFDRDATPILSIPEYHSTDAAKYYHKNIYINCCQFKSKEIAFIRQTENVFVTDCVNLNNEKMTIKVKGECSNINSNCCSINYEE